MSTIKHTEANIKIYFTRDYSRFKDLKGNRLLNDGKINRMISDINSGLDMLRYCPIIVDEKMNVIDGQHRLYVAKKLKSNVWYVITDGLTMHEIARINSNQERWKARDFIHCYSSQGVKDYNVLQDFIYQYQWPVSLAVIVLSTGKTKDGGGGMKSKEKFERGFFKATHVESANMLAAMVERFNEFEGYKSRPFIDAIGKLMDGGKCDFELLLEKFKSNVDMLTSPNNVKGYLSELESIYNKGAHKRKTIF